MPPIMDGPASGLFRPITLGGNARLEDLNSAGLSPAMTAALPHAPSGACTAWGIPFEVGGVVLLREGSFSVEFAPLKARWLVFMHTSDTRPAAKNASGFIRPMRGEGQLGEHAADYIVCYADGSEERVSIRRRFQVGMFQRRWGENCFEAVAQHKPMPMQGGEEVPHSDWGWSQTRVDPADYAEWMNWLWAWENPRPEEAISGLRFEPGEGTLVLSAVSAGDVSAHPLRWQPRQKACLRLPEGESFQPLLDKNGLLQQVQLDLGQVISATPRLVYDHDSWAGSYNNRMPEVSASEVILEYTAHPDACFHLKGGARVAAGQLKPEGELQPVPPAHQPVRLRVLERGSRRPVAVKLHVHGMWGEYLPPVDRHRILNPAWFEDYSADYLHASWETRQRRHNCTYINGETVLKLPQGEVYIEVSKGFEIRPVRKTVTVGPETEEIVIELEKVLPWRERGWVTADTHVHFLSPVTAMLEGAAEGVNVINLLASQWGELMTNVGDFDGKNTWGSREAGGEGEYLVRVGTENRQHVLGHISLLGYRGPIIAPMTTGGPDESALGDPVEALLTEWARQCHRQDGLVVLPHFPNPRAEHAAGIVSGEIDAVEMTSWENLYAGIDPYSLADWYRYLNCGYLLPAVGGTDKMTAMTAVGTVRTYARLEEGQAFTYDAWKQAVKRGETFASYGPLIEFAVNGAPMGGRISLPRGGGTLDVTWAVASTTVPVSRVELVLNGEIRESVEAPAEGASGHWRVRVERSAWLALLVRGHYADQPEMIAAHSTPVMVAVDGAPLFSEVDAVTILEQIEGALAYLDTVGTRAEDRAYRRMRLELEAAHRKLHNRMHQEGHFHEHTPPADHH